MRIGHEPSLFEKVSKKEGYFKKTSQDKRGSGERGAGSGERGAYWLSSNIGDLLRNIRKAHIDEKRRSGEGEGVDPSNALGEFVELQRREVNGMLHLK